MKFLVRRCRCRREGARQFMNGISSKSRFLEQSSDWKRKLRSKTTRFNNSPKVTFVPTKPPSALARHQVSWQSRVGQRTSGSVKSLRRPSQVARGGCARESCDSSSLESVRCSATPIRANECVCNKKFGMKKYENISCMGGDGGTLY